MDLNNNLKWEGPVQRPPVPVITNEQINVGDQSQWVTSDTRVTKANKATKVKKKLSE